MKSQLVILVILFLIISSPLLAQDYDQIRTTFQNFSSDVASTLPFLSSMGLNWSDAYIGTFPHFGFGGTAGAVTLPYDTIKAVADSLNIDISFLPDFLKTYGVPLPVACVEARLGGFIIPFDMGFKVGFIPEPVKELLPSDLSIDYFMVGGEVRFGLIEENETIPDVSIGIGVTYLDGSVTVSGFFDDTTYNLYPYTSYSIRLEYEDEKGSLNFFWRALSIELKAQVSKKILFMTFYIGIGESYNIYAEAGGGIEAPRILNSDTGELLSDDEINALTDLLPGLDSISSTGIKVKSSSTGWGLRVFGGLSFDIFFVKLDLTALYNILSQSLGASLNVRLQF